MPLSGSGSRYVDCWPAINIGRGVTLVDIEPDAALNATETGRCQHRWAEDPVRCGTPSGRTDSGISITPTRPNRSEPMTKDQEFLDGLAKVMRGIGKKP
jgi:hypothetical protein